MVRIVRIVWPKTHVSDRMQQHVQPWPNSSTTGWGMHANGPILQLSNCLTNRYSMQYLLGRATTCEQLRLAPAFQSWAVHIDQLTTQRLRIRINRRFQVCSNATAIAQSPLAVRKNKFHTTFNYSVNNVNDDTRTTTPAVT